MAIIDTLGRKFRYLRLSVTDVCNFKCVYCLPNGYPAKTPEEGVLAENPLSIEEIGNLTSAFARMGFWKVRLTGGEPTVRRDIVEIAAAVSATAGVREVALSTNGYRLKALADPLLRAGVLAFNISVDSLDPVKFNRMTGMDRAGEVLVGVDRLLETPGVRIKMNAVLMRGLNDSPEDLQQFMDWVRTRPVSVRFIELMRTGENPKLFSERHVSSGELRLRLLKSGWFPQERAEGDGPAIEFRHPDFLGSVGIIAPYSEGFCETCNRLRVNSRGALRLCLFGEGEQNLRDLLQSPAQQDELVTRVERLILRKAPSHSLHEGNYGITQNLSGIGG